MKLLRRCELIGCQEMGKWWVSECNKGQGICIIYYPHNFFSLVFFANWENKILWVRKDYFSHYFFSLLFSPMNQMRENYIFYVFFSISFPSFLFSPQPKGALMTKFTFLMVRTKDFFKNLSFPSTLFNFFLHKLNTEANPFLHCC